MPKVTEYDTISLYLILSDRKEKDMFDRIQTWDNRILSRLAKKHTPVLDRLMVIITTTGNYGYIWFALSVPLLIINRTRLTGITMILAMLITGLTGEITIKHIVARVRPCNKEFGKDLLIKHPAHYSFPSGHTASSFAVSMVMLFMLPTIFVPVVIYATLMGFSRMYLLVHYPTDVIAGSVLGVICGTIAVCVSPYIPFFSFLY